MNLSATPFLLIGLLVWTGWTIASMLRRGETGTASGRALWALLAALSLVGAGAVGLGLSGLSTSAGFLASWPLYWYPFVPVVIAVSAMLLWRPLRVGLADLADHRGRSFLLQVQLVRLLAIGGITKALGGSFTLPFALVVGGADLAFGLSALWVWWSSRHQPPGDVLLLWWNLAGALVILAPMLLLGHWFMQDAQFATLFAFPMLLAPALIVPLLVGFNLLMVWRLLTVSDVMAQPVVAGDGRQRC